MKEADRKILARIRQELQPPSAEECDRALARWLYGKHADKMLKYAPWSFVLTKVMWKKGEEPWAS